MKYILGLALFLSLLETSFAQQCNVIKQVSPIDTVTVESVNGRIKDLTIYKNHLDSSSFLFRMDLVGDKNIYTKLGDSLVYTLENNQKVTILCVQESSSRPTTERVPYRIDYYSIYFIGSINRNDLRTLAANKPKLTTLYLSLVPNSRSYKTDILTRMTYKVEYGDTFVILTTKEKRKAYMRRIQEAAKCALSSL
jgi:hypothetical protein